MCLSHTVRSTQAERCRQLLSGQRLSEVHCAEDAAFDGASIADYGRYIDFVILIIQHPTE